MTTRKLREEIQKYKDESQGKDAKIKELEDSRTTLEGLLEDTHKDIAALTSANQKMQSTLDDKDALHKSELDKVKQENQKELKEKDDTISHLDLRLRYKEQSINERDTKIQEMEQQLTAAENENKDLTKKLADAESKATIETVPPADYEDLKSKAERLVTVQSELDSVKAENAELKDNAEKTKADNDKTTKATAIIDNLVNAFRYAHSEFHAVYPENFPAEVQDNFNAIAEKINAIRFFILKE